MPPFSLFASEVALARAATAAGLGWAVAVALALLLVVFVAIAARIAGMLFGAPPATAGLARTTQSAAPLVAGLVALALLGTLAWPLDQLLTAAARIAGTP
jgi:hydrogenase-4 component F